MQGLRPRGSRHLAAASRGLGAVSKNKLIEFAMVILSAAKDLAGNARGILRFAQNDRRGNWSFCYDTAPYVRVQNRIRSRLARAVASRFSSLPPPRNGEHIS